MWNKPDKKPKEILTPEGQGFEIYPFLLLKLKNGEKVLGVFYKEKFTSIYEGQLHARPLSVIKQIFQEEEISEWCYLKDFLKNENTVNFSRLFEQDSDYGNTNIKSK